MNLFFIYFSSDKKIHSEKSVSESEVDLQFTNEQPLKQLYTNCKEKGKALCLGFPDNCIESENCDIVMAVVNTGYGMSEGTVSFQLIGKPDGDSGWIAGALSEDDQMGNDSVVECLLLSNSKTILRNSWNEGYSNQVIGDVTGIVQNGPVIFDKGLLNCKWTRVQNTKVKDMAFDLKNKKYYFLLAKGPIRDQNTSLVYFICCPDTFLLILNFSDKIKAYKADVESNRL